MKLYLDSNIAAHAQDVREGDQLARWLRDCGHRVVLTEVHLGEALAIADERQRDERLALLASLPALFARPLGYLQAREVVNEIRRVRPDWRRLPTGDETLVTAALRRHEQAWRQLRHDREALYRETSDYREVEQPAIQRARRSQGRFRENVLAETTKVTQLTLGDTVIGVRDVNLRDVDDFFRFESLLAWWQALVDEALTLSDYRFHAEPYIRAETLTAEGFVEFWLEQVDPDRLPRGLATSAVIRAQLDAKITHGNTADARHAGYLIDADVFVTEDRTFYRALERAHARLAHAARPVLLDRGIADLVGQAETALEPLA